jgi:hypothetical protein
MKLGIADIDVIPPYRKMKFLDLDDSVSFHTLFFEIDHEANMLMENPSEQDPNQGIKIKTYWQMKE